jgi:excisionase family DNA binding protein
MQVLLFSRPDAARLLAISIRKLDQLIQSKQVNVIKVGKRTLIARVELEKFARRGTGVKNGGRNGK